MPSFRGTLAILFSAAACFTTLTHGQSSAPTPVNGAAFARSRTKLYIHGGVQTFVTFRTSASSSGSAYLSNRYRIASNSWELSAVKVQNPTKEGIQAVEDQVSGLVYLAGGFQSDDSQMYVYNVDYDSISMVPMPSSYMEDRRGYAAVYLKNRKSIMYFGGSTSSNSGGQSSADLVTEFIPSTGSWTTL
ncbi:hypothetical protein BGZ70_000764, partial [Mortierella alpina]